MLKLFDFFLALSNAATSYSLVICDPSSDALFNLCFKWPNGTQIRTTFANAGYRILLRVNSSEEKVQTKLHTLNNVQFSSELVNVPGKGIRLSHTIKNTGNTIKNVSFSVHADAMIENNDDVPVTRLSNMRGIRLQHKGYLLDILFRKYDKGPPVDSIWVGYLGDLSSKNYWKNSTIDSYSDDDSAFAYSIQNKILLPKQSIQFGTATTVQKDINIDDILKIEPTLFFTASNKFTPSKKFTSSKKFTPSQKFTFSKYFSNSRRFTTSIIFSLSNDFTCSNIFTKTQKFSRTESFTMSNNFTKSFVFTNSNFFKPSQMFSASKVFTSTEKFTATNKFTLTKEFSNTIVFSMSDLFSDSGSFTATPTQSKYGQVLSYSFSYSPSLSFIKTVILTDVAYFYSICYSNSICTVSYIYKYNVPYLIFSLSTIYIPSYVIFYSDIKKKTLTQTQLIGVIAGSASVFFSILGIIIILKNRQNKYEDVPEKDSSSEQICQTTETNTQIETNIIIDPKNNDDFDIWI